jgi:hypothetical protein
MKYADNISNIMVIDSGSGSIKLGYGTVDPESGTLRVIKDPMLTSQLDIRLGKD